MKVVIELQSTAEKVYENAERVDDSDPKRVTVYGKNNCVLAVIDKSDLKNLFTEKEIKD